MIFYIADIHFGDLRVFNKCSKPFVNLDEYEDEIIRRWNNKVSIADDVYILGDIAEDTYSKVFDVLSKLNGEKHLIVGNHDIEMLNQYLSSKVFASVDYIKLIEDDSRSVFLCHYPIMDWMEFSRGGYLIYGHTHNKTKSNDVAYHQIKEYYKDKKAFNAGVDVVGYEPVTLDEMINLKERNKNEPYIN